MKVLVLGGTRFVGRHIASEALARGHDLTLFHRGQTTAPELASCEHVYGDRNRDLGRLGDRTWDAVIDTCAYVPRDAAAATRYFAPRTGAYALISSISVYDGEKPGPLTEDSAVVQIAPGADPTRVTPESYGALKGLCEAIVTSTFRHRALVLRPGLVAGPFDPTDRFTYWLVRIAAGGTVLAPGSPSHPLQYIDARDLAAFALSSLEKSAGGTYNVVTTPGAGTFGDLFAAAMRASGVHPDIRYARAEFLLENGVAPWSDMPLWIPQSAPEASLVAVSDARARVRGLQTRALLNTAVDTLNWAKRARRRLGCLKAGLDAGRESELLRRNDTEANAVK